MGVFVSSSSEESLTWKFLKIESEVKLLARACPGHRVLAFVGYLQRLKFWEFSGCLNALAPS